MEYVMPYVNEHTYSQLRALRSGPDLRARATTAPTNCEEAWRLDSSRGWRALNGAQRGRSTSYPAVVRQDGDLYICGAVAKLLSPNAYAHRTPTKRINRKGYFLLTEEGVSAILNDPKYCVDGFCRSSSAHVIHDGLDAGLWLRELIGSPIEGGWDAVVTAWEQGDTP